MMLTHEDCRKGHLSKRQFKKILCSPDITICSYEIDSNNYGEFVFVSISQNDKSSFHPEYTWPALFFYGYGYNTLWDRWVSNQWNFGQDQFPDTSAPFAPDDVLQRLEQRLAEIPKHNNRPRSRERFALEMGLHSDPDGFCSSFGDIR